MDITSNSKIILYSSFNSIFSSKFCGSKAIDYLCSLDSGNLCIVLKSDEVDSNIRVYEQIFRRLLKSVYDYHHSNIISSSSGSNNNSSDVNITQQQQRPPLQLYILLEEERSSSSALEDRTNDDDSVAIHYNKVLDEFLSFIWNNDYVHDNSPATTATISSLSDVLQLNIVPIKQSELSSIVKANDVFTNPNYPISSSPSSSSSSLVRQQIAPLLYSKWKSISSELHPILSNLQKQSLYKIELAYIAGLTQADIIISQWQKRVTSGKIIGKYATRLSGLLLNIKNDYNKNIINNIKNTKGGSNSIIRERSERLKLLNDYILIAGERLFRQQIIIIEYIIINKFRDNLLLLLQNNDKVDSNVDDDNDSTNNENNNLRESEQNLLRKCIFEYKTKISDLEDEKLNLILTEEKVNEFTTILTTVLSEFPESSQAKLLEIKKLEKKVKKKNKKNNSVNNGRGRKRKGVAKLLGISLQLVGMLRPPGFGNLQGYVGYATSLLGFPLDLLLGIQNDGDSPEVRNMMIDI